MKHPVASKAKWSTSVCIENKLMIISQNRVIAGTVLSEDDYYYLGSPERCGHYLFSQSKIAQFPGKLYKQLLFTFIRNDGT